MQNARTGFGAGESLRRGLAALVAALALVWTAAMAEAQSATIDPGYFGGDAVLNLAERDLDQPVSGTVVGAAGPFNLFVIGVGSALPVTVSNGTWQAVVPAGTITSGTSGALALRQGTMELTRANFTIDFSRPATPVATADYLLFNTVPPTIRNGTFGSGPVEAIGFLNGVPLPPVPAAANGAFQIFPDEALFVEGANTVTVQVREASGNLSDMSAPITITRDTSHAQPILSGLAPVYNGTPVTFDATGTPNNRFTIDIWRIKPTTGNVTSLLGPTHVMGPSGTRSVTVPDTLLTEGETYALWVSDGTSPNVSRSIYSFRFDALAPDAPAISGTDRLVTNDQFALSGTAQAEALVTILFDGVSAGTATADSAGNWTLSLSGATVSEAGTTVTATATDASGQTSPASAPVILTRDATPPEAPVVTGPAFANASQSSAAFNATLTADSAVTLQPFANGIALTAPHPAGGPGAISFDFTVPLSLMPEGTIPVSVIARDAAGNTSSGATSFVNDKTLPGIPTLVSADELVTTEDAMVTVQTEPFAALELTNTANVVLQTVTTDGTGVHTFTIANTLMTDGPNNNFLFRAIDQAGNRGNDRLFVRITKDTRAPFRPDLNAFSGIYGPAREPVLSARLFETGGTIFVQEDGVEIYSFPVTTNPTAETIPVSLFTDGARTVTIVHADAAGNRSDVSNGRPITVDLTPPSVPVVTVSQPLTRNGANLSVTLDVGTRLRIVRDDGRVIIDSPGSTGSAGLLLRVADLREGLNVFTVSSIDDVGNAASTTVEVTLDTTPPSVPVLTTASGDFTGTPLLIEGTTDPDSRVVIIVNNSQAATVMSDPVTGAFSASVGAGYFTELTNRVQAVASDALENQSALSSPIFLTDVTTGQNAPPTILGGDTVVGLFSDVIRDVDLNGSFYLYIYVNGVLYDEFPVTNGSGIDLLYVYGGDLLSGDNTVYVTGARANGTGESEPSSPIIVTLDDVPPVLTVSGLPALVNTPAPTVTLSAPGGAIVFIEVEDGSGFRFVTEVTIGDTPEEVALPAATLSEGLNTLYFNAYDAFDNYADPVEVAVTLDTIAPPAPVITTAPQVFGDVAPEITGIADPDTAIRVLVGTQVIGTATADGAGDWALTPAAAAFTEGPNSVTAIATDPAGNDSAASAPVVLTRDTTPPQPPVIEAATDIVSSSTTLFVALGTAEPFGTVILYANGTEIARAASDITGLWEVLADPALLAEGPNEITARLEDSLGNLSELSAPFPVLKDTTAPEPPTLEANRTIVGFSGFRLSGTTEPGSIIRLLIGATGVITITDVAPDGSWEVFPARLPDGVYDFRAVAVDAAGNQSGESQTIAITFDTVAPAAPVITTAEQVFADTVPAITGTAEPDSSVSIFVGGALRATVPAGELGDWSATLPATDFAEGPNLVTARATDQADNRSPDSVPLTLTRDTTAPAAPVFTSFDAFVSTRDTQFDASGTAEPLSTVIVFLAGAEAARVPVDAAGAWAVSLPLASFTEGPNSVTAQAEDSLGNLSPVTTIEVLRDTIAPDAPTMTASTLLIANDPPVLSGTAEPFAAVFIIFGPGDPVETTADAAGNWTVTPPIGNFSATSIGGTTFHAVAQDAAGNTSAESAPLTVVRDIDAPPAPSILTTDYSFSSGDQTILGSAETGATVTILVNGTPSGTATATPDWTYAVPEADLAEGVNIITAYAEDAAGNRGPATDTVETPLVLTRDSTAPEPPVITGTSGGVLDPQITVSGSAEPDSLVEVLIGGTPVAMVSADATGAWSVAIDTAIFAGEVNILTATATDALGNTSPPGAPVTVTLDRTAPTVTIAGPSGTLFGPFTLTVTFSEPVVGFDLSDLALTNGTASDLAGGPSVFTLTVTPVLGQTVTASIPAGAATDAAGYPSRAAEPISVATSDVGGELAGAEDELREIVLDQATRNLRGHLSANQQMTRGARDRLAAGPDGGAVTRDQPFDVTGTAEYSAGTLSTRGSFFGLRNGIETGQPRRLTFGTFDISLSDDGTRSVHVDGRVAWERQVGENLLWGVFLGGEVRDTQVQGDFTGTARTIGASTGLYMATEMRPGLYFDGAVTAGLARNRLDLDNGTIGVTSDYTSHSFALSGAVSGRIARGRVEFWPELSFGLARTDIGAIDLVGRNAALTEAVLTSDMGQVTLAEIGLTPEIRLGLDGRAPAESASVLSVRPSLDCERITRRDGTTQECGYGLGLSYVFDAGQGTRFTLEAQTDAIGGETRNSIGLSFEHEF